MNGLLEIFEKISQQGITIAVTNYVYQEVVDRPSHIPRFELGALREKKLIDKKIPEKLEQELTNKQGNVAYVLITATNNTGGGVPVSMQNMRLAREICRRHQVLFFLDGARFLENAQFIKELESGYQDKPVKEIVKEMCSYFDGMLMSSKKDAFANMGGFLALNNKDWASKARQLLILTEGFATYGGLAGRVGRHRQRRGEQHEQRPNVSTGRR